MVRPHPFQVLLDRPVYFAGQEVKGRVKLAFAEKTRVTRIELTIMCRSYGFWIKNEEKRSVSQYNWSREIILFGKLDKQSKAELSHPAGFAEYPFSVDLPRDLPHSLEHCNGSIRYTATCHIDIPWAPDYWSREPFTVISMVDLNTLGVERPLTVKGEKTFGFGCFTSTGKLLVRVNIPKRGFVPGECVPIRAKISNESSHRVRISVRLIQFLKMNVACKMPQNGERRKDKQKTRSRQILEYCEPFQVGAFINHIWRYRLEIPALPPTVLQTDGVLELAYELLVTLNPRGPHFDLDIRVPIKIGNVPVKRSFDDFMPTKTLRLLSLPEELRKKYPDLPQCNIRDGITTALVNAQDEDEIKIEENSMIVYNPSSIFYPTS